MRAVDAIMECLKAEGVDTVFGIPGGANLPTYDALYDAGIRHILCRHEQGAGHAAEGYAKASGKVGVALATSGPGATNLVTAIADAVMDSVPDRLHHRPGAHRPDRHRRLPGGRRDRHHDADRQALADDPGPARDPGGDPRGVPHRAHRAAPGPVLVDIPQDLSRADIHYEPVDDVHLPGYQPTTEGNAKQIRLAAKALANSRRPVIYAGGGVINANAAAELTELAASDRFPVTCTLMGLGGFPAPHEQWLGMLGMHGTRTANYAMDEADLIVAIGARFDDRITGKLSEFAPRAKFIHIDVDPAEISKNVPAHIPIVGDAKKILPKLTREYRALETDPSRLDGWWQRIQGWREKLPARLRGLGGLGDQAAVHGRGDVRGHGRRRDHHLGRRPAPDVGGAVLPLREAAPVDQLRRPRHDGLRACRSRSAPRSACPDQTVVCLAGDGSLQMNSQELATAVTEDIPVKVFLMNNGYLGMVRQWQELFWDRRYSAVRHGHGPRLGEARRGLRRDGHARDRQGHARGADARGARHRRARGARRARDQGGELLPDDPRPARRPGTWWAERWVSLGTKEVLNLADLEAAGGIHTGRKHILSMLVENKPGVLARIAGLFSRRGFNIETLAVGPTDDPTLSRMTLTLDGALHPIDQVTKQLHKLVNVIKIRDLEPEEAVARELALFKVSADGETRGQVMQFTDIFRGKVIDVSKRSITVEITGTDDKIEAFEQAVRPFGLIEMVRTGEIAISRGRSAT